MNSTVLLIKAVTKEENGHTLLDNFNLHLFKGDIMGLICVDGMGRNFIVELLLKNIPIDYGFVYIDNKKANSYEYSSMLLNSVSVIEKNCHLIENLSIFDNIFVLKRDFNQFVIHDTILNEVLNKYASETEIDIKEHQYIFEFSSYEKLVVELIKAILSKSKIIIIKDISDKLTALELSALHRLIRYYSKKGFTFLYICNHHEEAFKICNKVSLMKNGKIKKTLFQADFSDDAIFKYIPDCLKVTPPHHIDENDTYILTFENISTSNINNMNFSLKKGECVIIVDIDNTIHSDICSLMGGELKSNTGTIYLEEKIYDSSSFSYAVKNGVDFISENPIETMLFKEMDVLYNLAFLTFEKFGGIFMKTAVKKSILKEYYPAIGIDIYEKNILNLSIKSLYNIIYYRIYMHKPKIVFCTNPFYSCDMYVRQQLIKLINIFKKRGITVVILASNISDALLVSDRMIMMNKNGIIADYSNKEFNIFNTHCSTFEKFFAQ